MRRPADVDAHRKAKIFELRAQAFRCKGQLRALEKSNATEKDRSLLKEYYTGLLATTQDLIKKLEAAAQTAAARTITVVDPITL